MLLLKQDIIKKEQVDKALLESEKNLKFKFGSSKEYEVKIIIDNTMYS